MPVKARSPGRTIATSPNAPKTTLFSDTVAERRLVVGMATDAAPLKLWGEQTTTNYFTTLGVPAALGRAYTPADYAARRRRGGASRVAVAVRRRSRDRRPRVDAERTRAAKCSG